MYDLMNKDVVAAKIHKGQDGWYVAHPQAALPAGKFEINDWLEDRKAYKHNHHLKRLMVDCGCDTVEGFLRITHAASINDSYWVKKEGKRYPGRISPFTAMSLTAWFPGWPLRGCMGCR